MFGWDGLKDRDWMIRVLSWLSWAQSYLKPADLIYRGAVFGSSQTDCIVSFLRCHFAKLFVGIHAVQ